MDYDRARQQLLAMDPQVRRHALERLAGAWNQGKLACAAATDLINMHSHTFFSYSGYDLSPSALAWLARESGWHAFAKVDFDVLDGIDETLAAGDLVRVRAAAGVETRVFLAEMSNWEFNSPGEPGVLYYVGMGFASEHVPDEAVDTVQDMRQRAADRYRDMVLRLNAYLDPVAIDYERDVLPLTPSGNATERHVLVAYDKAARRLYRERGALLSFWAGKLGMTPEQVGGFLGDEPYPHDVIRAKLMKRGGVAYPSPGPDTFPPLDAVNDAIIACGAIPTYAFLDGLSDGEQHMADLLELLISKGMAGLTIIPDRNWDYSDPEVRAVKVAELDKVMGLARDLDLPVIVGTEMNKPGQRQVDDFGAAPLRPFWKDFSRGADFIYGHTFMHRVLGLGYQSLWARANLPTRRERNVFCARVGAIAEPGSQLLTRVAEQPGILEPDQYLQLLSRLALQ